MADNITNCKTIVNFSGKY